jgi:hypothetical protein
MSLFDGWQGSKLYTRVVKTNIERRQLQLVKNPINGLELMVKKVG